MEEYNNAVDETVDFVSQAGGVLRTPHPTDVEHPALPLLRLLLRGARVCLV